MNGQDAIPGVTEAPGATGAGAVGTGASAPDAATDIWRDLTAEAGAALRNAARGRAAGGRDFVADQSQRWADELRQAAGRSGDGLPSRLLETLAQGIDHLSDDLRSRSVASIAADIGGLARANPGAFAAGAGLLGFAAARFVLASARAPVASGSTGAAAEMPRHGIDGVTAQGSAP